MIEGNLYSPQAAAMISFVLQIEKNPYGLIENEIFIEVSDYVLTTVENQVEQTNPRQLTSKADDKGDKSLAITHYLFAALLLVIVSTGRIRIKSSRDVRWKYPQQTTLSF